MLRAELNTLRASAGESTAAASLSLHKPKILGFDDGTILPPEDFELGTSSAIMGAAAASRAPLRGDLRVIVVLVQFPDAQITRSKSEFETLFFTAGTNSVADFFSEASGGLVSIKGEIVGPYTLPRNLSEYANNSSGTGRIAPNAQTMAFDAATAAMAEVDQSLDNDGNGLVDAFIVVHAGRAAEETNNKSDIWSHKWVLPTGAISAPDGTRIYAYLTVPEDARVGVCAHELGHLVFGWPDLYDTDGSSEGVGNWCLMGGGSWNGAGVEAFRPGDVPSQPSAWCKATQGWVDVVVQKRNAQVTISDVGKSRTIYRMWKDGTMASEYFLVENRQREGFDRGLPSSGLLIWHIDDSITSNTNDSHYKVALLQADGRRDLERAANRGDAGDPYPDNSRNSNFDAESNPSSRSYSGMATSVAVTAIPASSRDMSVRLSVTPDSTARRRTVTRKDKPTREGSLT
ncbi:MAG TPA: M6 family metalloprotease domain-containing protein [Thermoanaerobaculia bacterium]|nr:M6 family metalloprotease domain-containing protein [Thermoanaerobaculia bacterium]